MRITYLFNSGFLLQIGRLLLVFDDYQDTARAVDRAIDAGEYDRLYFFASHAHFDHFDTHIRAYAEQTSRYIFSNDIRRTKRVRAFPPNSITYLKKYSAWEDDTIRVSTYDSTDIGVSFLVELKEEGLRIFHAGDFNWWHWENDTQENQALAKNAFQKQMKHLAGLEAELAFFPVDGRLGGSSEMGAREFVRRANIKALVAMHRVGYPRWEPEPDFFGEGQAIPVWAPIKSGEAVIYAADGFRRIEADRNR